MTRIELTEKEAAILIEILESFLSDLKTERVRTEKRELHANSLNVKILSVISLSAWKTRNEMSLPTRVS